MASRTLHRPAWLRRLGLGHRGPPAAKAEGYGAMSDRPSIGGRKKLEGSSRKNKGGIGDCVCARVRVRVCIRVKI